MLLALAMPAWGSSVQVSGTRYHGLLPPEEPKPERAPGPRVVSREVEVEPLEDGLRVKARWTVDTDRRGWFAGELIGSAFHVESLSLEGGLSAHTNGANRHVYGWLEDEATIEIVAVLDGWNPGSPVDLRLLGAPRGLLVLDSDAYELSVGGASAVEVEEAWWTGAQRLMLGFERPVAARPRSRAPLLTARAGVGLTARDSEIEGRGRLSWQVLRGEVATVAFSGAGVGPDLEVTGPNVRSFRREGTRIVVELNEPSDGRVDVDVHWTQVLADSTAVAVPAATLKPEGFRVEQSLQVARDGDREIVPRISGATPMAASQLPTWGQGLIEGTPTTAYVGAPGGSLSLLRFEPVSGPAVVVDVAQYTIATSEEGRVLMRALYEVRNERAQWLDVRPPAGMTILGARVGADTAMPSAGEDGTWRIPLLRSVETVEGLLTFPVEVALIGEVGSWNRREERALALPTLDAEVALSRTTLYLPPGYHSALDDNEAGSVPAFLDGEGLAYGFGVGDTGAAQADALFQEAVSGWMANDFDKAQIALDELRSMGGDNENVRRLQSNLDLVGGTYSGGADEVATRRIREQARARGLEDERKAADLKRKADEAQLAGDYGGSSALYSEYIALADKLEQLEQEESVEYKSRRAEAEKGIATNASFDAQRQIYEPDEADSLREGRSRRAGGRSRDADGRDLPSKGEVSRAISDFDGVGDDDAWREPNQPTTGATFIPMDPSPTRAPSAAEDAIATIFDASSDPLFEATGEFAGRDLLGEAVEGGQLGGLTVSGTGMGGGGYGYGSITVEGRGSVAGALGSSDVEAITLESMEIQAAPARAYGAVVSQSRKSRGGGSGGRKTASAPRPSPRPMAGPQGAPPPPPSAPMAEPEEDEWSGAEMMDEAWIDEDATDVSVMEVETRGRSGGRSLGAKKKTEATESIAYERDTIELFSEEPDAPEVTATSLSIVVPNLGGETVLYQTLLLDPGEAPHVLVRARFTKKNP